MSYSFHNYGHPLLFLKKIGEGGFPLSVATPKIVSHHDGIFIHSILIS
jgi:hypothetical protein